MRSISKKVVKELGLAFIIALVLTGSVSVAVRIREIPESWADAIRHSALVSVSVAAAWWPVLAGIEALTVLLWLALLLFDKPLAPGSLAHPDSLGGFLLGKLRLWIVHSNRIVESTWALLTALVLVLLHSADLIQMIYLSGLLLLMGPHLASALGLALSERIAGNHDEYTVTDL